MPRIPGTHVALDPPPGFEPAHGFSGWSHPDREAAIAVTELPTPREVMASELTPERLAARGSTVVWSRREAEVLWVRVHEEPWTGPVERWMVVLGDDRVTALVIATAPSGDEVFASAIEDALRTATFDPGAVASPFDGLPFTVTEAGGLQVAARSHAVVVLTEGGAVGQVVGAPMMTVGSYESPGDPTDWYSFATGHLKDLSQVTALGEVQGAPVELAGGTLAYELVTDGISSVDGRPMVVYELAASRTGLRVVVSGLVAHDGSDRWLPVFREVARSLRVAAP